MRVVRATAELVAPAPDEPVVAADGASLEWDNDDELVIVVEGDARVSLVTGRYSRPRVRCVGRARLRLETRMASAPTVNVEDHAEARVRTYGRSTPVLRAEGTARVRLTSFDESRPQLSTRGSSQAQVIVQDDSRPYWDDWPAGWTARRSEIYLGQRVLEFGTREDAVDAARILYEEWNRCHNRYLACLRTPGAIVMVCDDVVDFRWREGTVHLELPAPFNPRAWYSTDAHDPEPYCEARRASCTRHYLEPEE
ncbi:MAG: hypothetical protein JO148_16525 [Acidimicrobiia bacterium]|nr:hypothetical protein [Acidimicrobiia bacterium]